MKETPGAELLAPHEEELQKFRDERRQVRFALIGGETVEGVIRWFDREAIHLTAPDRSELTVFKRALLFYRAA